MKAKLKKCIISRYDETIKEAPFLTIPFDKVDVFQPDVDHLGEEFADRLKSACFSKGYIFKFYTSCSEREDVDYEIVVY